MTKRNKIRKNITVVCSLNKILLKIYNQHEKLYVDIKISLYTKSSSSFIAYNGIVFFNIKYKNIHIV